MIQALMAGVASIQAQQTRMDVIGNDLANINTTAFKSSDVNFQDLISQEVSGATAPSSAQGGTNPVQYGLGVQVAGTTTNEAQGSLTATANPSDLAIQGGGYFMVSNGTAVSYTRDGSFSVDAAGNVDNSATGQKVLGWTADANGNIDTTKQITAASTLQIPIGSLTAAQATTQISVGGNLASTATVTPPTTADVTTTVYNSLGAPEDVTFQFTAAAMPTSGQPAAPAGAASTWSWTAYSGDAVMSSAQIASSASPNSQLYFDANGAPVSGLAAGVLNQITVPPPAGSSASPTTFGMDVSGLDQLGTTSSASVTNQNGFPPGSLDNYSINTQGVITGGFTNGLTRTLGQIALSTFSNPSGLVSTGDNAYTTSLNSGLPDVGPANAGGRGNINSGYVEASNVDLSTDLTNLIVTQRAFESNTKIVSTVDQMLQDLIQMKPN